LDNAVAEFFFKSLITELVYGSELISRGQMKPENFWLKPQQTAEALRRNLAK
jgi:hypothetical protein